MSADVLSGIETDQFRDQFSKYTELAFHLLPKIERPHILDVGCGSGIPTLVLAKLCDGEIVGIDIDQRLLDRLKQRAEELGLSSRVFAKQCSLFDMDFQDETFDIIWAEGSIHLIGFERGLKKLRALLKPKGFLVVHDGVKVVSNKLENVHDLGYELINHFRLPDDAWRTYYFEPLELLIKEWHKKAKTPEDFSILERYQKDVNMFKRNPKENISAFYIFQKT
jgi:SAM-dependent methyltransferase